MLSNSDAGHNAATANPKKLRELAGWYREFAERAGNVSIWESRLRLAQELEAEADRLERRRSLDASR